MHKASRLREAKGQTQDLREPHSSQGDQGSSPGSRERRTSRPTMNPHVVSMAAAALYKFVNAFQEIHVAEYYILSVNISANNF